MAEVAVEYLIAKLEDWITKETNKQDAVEVSKIKDEFCKIRSFLKYADWRRMTSDGSDTCSAGVIRLACEVEDVIDEDCYTKIGTKTEFSLSSVMEVVSESLNYLMDGKTQHKSNPVIAFLRKKVAEKLNGIEFRKNVHLFNSFSENNDEGHILHSQTFSENLHLTRVVGRVKEVKILRDWMLEEDEYEDTQSVFVVAGVDGIGKTAVAGEVYECCKTYFDCAAWVFVSGKPTISILRELLICFSRAPHEAANVRYFDDMEEKELGKRIHDFLIGKKFLLVMDDLDSLESWENVKCLLPIKCVGKILITTSNPKFPTDFGNHVLNLEPLYPKDASELLHRRVFLQNYEPKADKILGFCEGHPLLIAMVSGILSTSSIAECDELEKVFASNFFPKFDMIQKILVVSYFSLPPVLKCCLLCCVAFPAHCEISCKRLIRIWVAEGFIAKQLLGMTEEEIAKNHVEDLVRRNLLEVARFGTNGEIISCRLLRSIQDFILKTLNSDYCWIMHKNIKRIWSSDATRILAVHGGIKSFAPSSNVRSIRSLLFFKENGLSSPRTPSIIFSSQLNIKFLRVLELQNSRIDSVPDSIGNLVLLRYINLRGTSISTLPVSLNNLHELQTLDIRDTNVRSLPAGFDSHNKMLRHLLLSSSFSKRAVKLNGDIMFFKDLQTLAGIKLTQLIAFGLNYLPQLLKLSVSEVEGRENSSHLSKSIDQMQNLTSLTIKCAWRKEIHIQTSNSLENLEKLRVGGWVKDLLGWVSKLESLKQIYLWDCMFQSDPISSLQHLPKLTVLSLCNVYKGKQICCDDSVGFPSLKKLLLVNFEELEEWTKIEMGSMKNLQSLVISKCPKLKQPPKGLESLVDLQVLHIKDMPAEFVNLAQEISSNSALHFSVSC